MTQIIKVHPENPQNRLILQAVDILKKGGVIIYPTDSSYALGCQIGDKAAALRIRQIRDLKENHPLSLLCKNLSHLSLYAQVSNSVFRLLKAHTPGPYTFILKASHEVPKRLQHPKRKDIGLRIPDNRIVQALLTALGEPLLSCSLILPGHEELRCEPLELEEYLEGKVDLIIDGGALLPQYTSIIDLTKEKPLVLREGKGDVSAF